MEKSNPEISNLAASTTYSPVQSPSVVNLSFSVENHHRSVENLATSSMPPGFDVNGQGISHEPNLTSQGRRLYNPVIMQVQDILKSGLRLEGCVFIRFAMTEEGSAMLVNLLALNLPGITTQIFERISDSLNGIPFVCKLMTSQYGYHVFTKLVDSCTLCQMAFIVYDIIKDQNLFVQISLQEYGSNSIKKLVKVLKKTSLIFPLIDTLSVVLFTLITDRIGSHIIFECLANLNVHQNKPLYEAVIHHCLRLATHYQGCISLQAFIDNIQGPHRNRLLDLIASNAVFLSQDPSGNFVVQKVLGLKNPVFTEQICFVLRSHYATLSMQKGGSHVVEKCLKSHKMHSVVDDLLSNSNQLLKVARHRYGNYVIQTALKVTKQAGSPQYQSLLTSLPPQALQSGYGLNVLKFLCLKSGSGDSVQQ